MPSASRNLTNCAKRGDARDFSFYKFIYFVCAEPIRRQMSFTLLDAERNAASGRVNFPKLSR